MGYSSPSGNRAPYSFARASGGCQNASMKKSLNFFATLLAAALIFLSPARAQQSPQTPAPATQQLAASGAQQTAPAASAQAPATTPKKAPSAKTGQTPARKTTTPLTLDTQKDKVSYAIGMNIGTAMKRDGLDVDTAILLRGVKDALAGSKPLMTEQEAQAA